MLAPEAGHDDQQPGVAEAASLDQPSLGAEHAPHLLERQGLIGYRLPAALAQLTVYGARQSTQHQSRGDARDVPNVSLVTIC